MSDSHPQSRKYKGTTEHTNKTFPVFGKRDITRRYPVSCFHSQSAVLRAPPCPAINTLLVDHYIHLAPSHDTNAGICCAKVNANNGLSWLDRGGGGGGGGRDSWEHGKGADENKEEEEDTGP
jgi:hypothetical protein